MTDYTPGRRFLVFWVGLVGRRALPVLVLAAVLSAAGLAYTLANLTINTSTTEMLSEELPFRKNHKALKAAFPELADNIAVVVEADRPEAAEVAAEALAEGLRARGDIFLDVFYLQGDPFFIRNGLLFLDPEALQDVGDRMLEAAPLLGSLNQDPSLRGLSKLLRLAVEEGEGAGGGGLDIALRHFAEAVERLADGQPKALSWRSLLSDSDGTAAQPERRFIRVKPALDHSSLQPAAAAVQAVREVAAEQGLTGRSDLRVRMTGDPLMFQEELETLSQSMGLIGLISVLLVAVVLGFGVRSPRLVGAILATLFVGLVWTAAFATLTVGALNLISVAFAVLFIGLGVDFGIHYGLRYKEEVEKGHSQSDALAMATTAVGGALALCAICTTIGFFSFLPTDYRGLSELGLISGGGMIIALVANLTVLPAILTVMPLKASGGVAATTRGLWPQGLAARHRRLIVRSAVLLGLLSLFALPQVRFDDDPLNLRDPRSESVATFLDLFDDKGAEPYEVHVLSDGLADAVAAAGRLRELPEVKKAVTLQGFVPEGQDEKLTIVEELGFFLAPVLDPAERQAPPEAAEESRAMEELKTSFEAAEGPHAAGAKRLAAALRRLDLEDPGTLSALQENLLGGLQWEIDRLDLALQPEPVSLETLPAGLRGRYLAANGTARTLVLPAEDLRDRSARLAFVKAVQSVAPGVIGAPVIIAEAGEAVVRAFKEAMGYAVVMVTLLLLLLLRSARDTLLVLAPLVLAALFTVAAAVLAGIPFNFANVIVLPLLFGLGTNSGIHMVLRHREDRRGKPLASGSTPRAVLLSALTTLASFGALALSDHQGTASMGKLLTISILQLLICTLLVLPALLASAWREEAAGAEARRMHPAP